MSTRGAAAVRRTVGRQVAVARRARGWTQEALAEKLGISTRYLQSIEAGRENLTIDSLVKLSRTLRVQVVELFGKG